MPEEKTSSSAGSGNAGNKVFWLFIVLLVSALTVFLSFIWLGKQGIDSTADAMVEIVTAFNPEEVVETFEEWRELEASGTEGNILEVATATATEKFTRKTNLAMFGKTLPLGTTVSEISVPATYRYHIDLNDDWFVTTDGRRLLVLAPDVQPSFPVAFDTAKVQKKTRSGWARWDGDENLAELEKTITAKLAVRAADRSSIQKIRDESREAVAKFVQSWLLSREAWGETRFEEIVVMFDGEDGTLSGMPPALRHLSEEEAVAP